MSEENSNESMLDLYIFETSKHLETLETEILKNEKDGSYSEESVNEIFRIMHTIKGSSAMMLFNNIANLAHSAEDVFYFLREKKPQKVEYSELSEIVLDSVDFMKAEIEKIRNGEKSDEDASELIQKIKALLELFQWQNDASEEMGHTTSDGIKQYYIPPEPKQIRGDLNFYEARIIYESDCEMENIRAYTLVNRIKELTDDIQHVPKEILENDASLTTIHENGFQIFFSTAKTYKEMYEFLMLTPFLKDLELHQIEAGENPIAKEASPKYEETVKAITAPEAPAENNSAHVDHETANQTMISVGIGKLDKLMDLMGEMVIAEAMVLQNPEILDLQIESFQKASIQLHKITAEMQDTIMSVRMVPVATVFQKMNRVVRDMNKKLQKDVTLQMIGESTEIDKNLIEHISDPLMHLVRNCIDHGIESCAEREAMGKQKHGTVTLEARNEGSDVLIIVKDDGKGFDKNKIIQKAKQQGLLTKPEKELTEKEIYNLIFLPGFSTNDNITEFSGRGVGMDVVVKNVETVGGMVSLESVAGEGSTVTIKIPLTTAIIDGMNIRVGKANYTIPTISIKESFKPSKKSTFSDPNGNEMVMVREECLPILRLHKYYDISTEVVNFKDGVFILIDHSEKQFCIFADEILGQHEVVVKALPKIVRRAKKLRGLSGCTLLGDGSISLILNIDSFAKKQQSV